ncbi:hypothetical protein Tsubulata_025733 [Turnera subulata]|uniref:F-box domain-containing protein n=1 Tax=Turnera subulata TaxID=218843 RepID=A0A9Q0JBI6_9ROSI|nr:hypothetical protein Tsubulata_025733 [Turnera subulata]
MELIPGLPDDIARDCLIRVKYKQFSGVESVNKAWKTEIRSPEFRQHRKGSHKSQRIIVMAQARINPDQSSNTLKQSCSPVYRFTVLEPETGDWSELPPVPEFTNGLPMFCQVACVGSDLVVLGGLDPVTWEVSNSVHVFSFLSATWRRGKDMPGVRRSFFGCASDLDRTVYVVGGHDGDKNALRSVLAYDVASDEWASLPDMARERDECKAIFQRGRLHVVGGYCTEMQGRFERTAEAFDFAKWQWGNVQDEFLEAATCPKACVYGDDGKVYMCRGCDVAVLEGSTWRNVAKLPADVCNATLVTTWQDKLLVIGSARFGEPHMGCVLDLKKYKWTQLEFTEKYSGHVQSGCFIEV